MIIAITGCIGSGKSYILSKINEIYGYDIYSSDEIVKQSYFDDTIKSKLDEHFKCIVNNQVDKSIIKSKLTSENVNVLNSIIHPYVINKIKEIKENSKNELVFIEVPLLYESKMEIFFDYVIAVSVDDNLRRNRLKNRDEKSYLEMVKLEKYQLSNEEKCKNADFILHSSVDDADNLSQLDKIIKKIIN
jgi:dephospho-CoA kinase